MYCIFVYSVGVWSKGKHSATCMNVRNDAEEGSFLTSAAFEVFGSTLLEYFGQAVGSVGLDVAPAEIRTPDSQPIVGPFIK